MKKGHKWSLIILFSLLIFSFLLIKIKELYRVPQMVNAETESFIAIGPEALIENYGSEIDKYAKKFQLNSSFLKALCMLECSGRKPAKSRFETQVYRKLNWVKKGLVENFEHVKEKHLRDADESALINLATSWGPFQLMGYKCILLDIKIKDIRGEEGVYWAIKWINETYGTYIKKKKYKDAFHIHNTGRPIGKNGSIITYDPNYIANGMKWIDYFDKHENK